MLNLFLLSLSKFCIWFYFGVKTYLNITKGNFGLYLKNKLFILDGLSFFHLFFIFFVFFFITSLSIKLILFKFGANIVNINDLIVFMSSNNFQTTPQVTEGAKTIVNSAGNSAIMAASVAAAVKIANQIPSVSGKIAAFAGGLGLGAGAIATKNIVSNVTENIGKTKSLLPSLSEFFGLTGNSLKDLLIMINYFQTIQLFFILLILYYLIIYFIDLTKLESYLSKIVPTKLLSINFYILNTIKKIGLFTIFSLVVLTLIAAYLNVGYLNFLLENLDKIIEISSPR